MTPSLQRALIIDDEPPARDDLRRLLAAHPTVEIAGEAGRLDEARAALARNDYDLVFLDVQLRGGTGFDLAPGVRPGARIIFVTGFERYALRAFDINALDYLLKPVQPARLAEALRRAEPRALAEAPGDVPAMLRYDDATLLKTDSNAARFVQVSELLVIFSAENYTELHLASGSRLLVRRTMKAWEDVLPPADLMRVHRTALVNLHAVERVQHQDRETTLLFVGGMKGGPVHARRELWPEIERRLAALKKRAAMPA